MSNLSKISKAVQTSLCKHSPGILTGIGIAGMITAAVLAVRATPKALRLIEEKATESGADNLTPVETVKASWRLYIPAAVTCCVSVACLIGANSMNARRNAALATAYALSESALREYREKVVETVGEKREQAVKDAVAKEKICRNPVSGREVIITEKGDTLCYDSISGRYFKSDIDKIKKAVNEINKNMLDDMYVSLNDFYYELGLGSTKLGDDLGWNVNRGLLEINFSSQLADDGTPCLVMDYQITPKYDFYK